MIKVNLKRGRKEVKNGVIKKQKKRFRIGEKDIEKEEQTQKARKKKKLNIKKQKKKVEKHMKKK